jgi:hypothetical protein
MTSRTLPTVPGDISVRYRSALSGSDYLRLRSYSRLVWIGVNDGVGVLLVEHRRWHRAGAALAGELEQRGYGSMWLPEHSHIPVERGPGPFGETVPDAYMHLMDPFVSLATAAVTTTRLLLGTGVSMILEHDLLDLACRVATLDVLSAGRFRFGVGVGWIPEELANHRPDVPFESRYALRWNRPQHQTVPPDARRQRTRSGLGRDHAVRLGVRARRAVRRHPRQLRAVPDRTCRGRPTNHDSPRPRHDQTAPRPIPLAAHPLSTRRQGRHTPRCLDQVAPLRSTHHAAPRPRAAVVRGGRTGSAMTRVGRSLDGSLHRADSFLARG